jgi:mannose-6-phosphate isomerase-like protein (cupin superfamily)
VLAAVVTALTGVPASAQSAADLAAVFASAGDVSALVQKAKTARQPDQPNVVQPVVKSSGYTLNLEYRWPGLKAPASVHDADAEIFFVVEGTGTAVTGGTLENGKRTNPANMSGTGITGGQTRRLAKGDVLFVPASSPHWFDPVGGPLVLLSLHVQKTFD